MKSPLRVAREKRGMTLNALAKIVGSDVGNLSRIERGVQTPNAQLAERICREFDGEINELQLIYPARYAEPAPQPAPQPQ
jgi:transcriptional regulator with XRE-family HTH domain